MILKKSRRDALAAMGASALRVAFPSALPTATLLLPVASAATAPLGAITVLYRREDAASSKRVDIAPLAAASQLEKGFRDGGFVVRQPAAKDLELLDQNSEVVVNFNADAGASLMFSVVEVKRPRPGDMVVVEVRLRARVFLGPSVLVAGTDASGVGRKIATVPGAEGERAASELAAQEAANDLVKKVVPRLKALTAADVAALARPLPSVVAGGMVVALPRPAPAALPASVGDPNAPLPAPKRKFALIVGMADYTRVNQVLAGRFRMGNLPGVAADMRILQAALGARGFASEDVVVLANAEATSANVRGQLMALAGKVGVDDLVLVAFSAHGAPAEFTPSGYGLPVLDDFNPQGKIDRNAIDFWQIQGLIGHLPARQAVLVVDTCHAGGAAMRMPRLTMQGGQAPSVTSGTIVPEPAKLAGDAADPSKHYAVMAASQPEELSLEDRPHGGLFTTRLVRGLAAAAGKEPLSQIFSQRVEREVIEVSRVLCKQNGECKVQTPIFAFAGRGNQIRI